MATALILDGPRSDAFRAVEDAALRPLRQSCCWIAVSVFMLGPLRTAGEVASSGPRQSGNRPPGRAGEILRFDRTEGKTENHFFRQGGVAAHLLTSSGLAPRLIVAFPAGNTGVGLWFDAAAEPAQFSIVSGTKIEGVERADGMRGVSAHLQCSVKTMHVRNVVLANIRTIRDYMASGFTIMPPAVSSEIERGPSLRFYRSTVDGKHHIELQVIPEDGTVLALASGKISLTAGASGRIRVFVTALVDDVPLTPFALSDLLTDAAANQPRDRQALAFLASEEKFLAGSWRFLTYFGRDTLLSLRMLMPVLKPHAIEAALGSVIERLGPDGAVAHEEVIGEWAVPQKFRADPSPAVPLPPLLDYKMVDGDFLFAPVLAAYLIDTPEGTVRAGEFLAQKTSTGTRYDERLRVNLELVLARSEPFATGPDVRRLVALKDGVAVGNWRDSRSGLGGGRYPFDVNAALVPAALRAAARLYRSGLLGPAAELAAKADQFASAWQQAAGYFRITIPADIAKKQVAEYSKSLGLDPTAAVSSIDRPVCFDGVSIDAAGNPVPVMNTDTGFVLLFAEPTPEYLDSVAWQILRPFPAGLRTDVGLVVANPAYASAGVQRKFTTSDYHGTVVWSWQQALLAAGLNRQLTRTNLPDSTRGALKAAERALWDVILAMKGQSTGELWSWEAKAGRESLVPFGQGGGHVDESNAVQLWSTVYLGVQPPAQ